MASVQEAARSPAALVERDADDEDLREQLYQQQIVAETIAAMTQTCDLDVVLQELLFGMRRLTGADSGGVRLLADPERLIGPCRLFFWRGDAEYDWLDVENLPGSNTARVLERGQGEYTPDLRPLAVHGDASAQTALERDSLASSLIVPLRAGGRPIGTLHADSHRPHAFDAARLPLLQMLADYVGGAVAQVRLHAEAAAARSSLAAALTRLDDGLSASATLVVTYDEHEIIESVDGPCERLLGWRREELIGASLRSFAASEALPDIAAALAAYDLRDPRPLQFETLARRPSGQLVPVGIAVRARWQGERFIGGAGAVTDLSWRKRLEAERDALLAAAARAEGAIRTGRAVAHELGSPLGAILGLAELLAADARLPPDVCADLGIIEAEAKRAGDLVQRFSTLARYTEIDTPVGPQLDVHVASAPE